MIKGKKKKSYCFLFQKLIFYLSYDKFFKRVNCLQNREFLEKNFSSLIQSNYALEIEDYELENKNQPIKMKQIKIKLMIGRILQCSQSFNPQSPIQTLDTV